MKAGGVWAYCTESKMPESSNCWTHTCTTHGPPHVPRLILLHMYASLPPSHASTNYKRKVRHFYPPSLRDTTTHTHGVLLAPRYIPRTHGDTYTTKCTIPAYKTAEVAYSSRPPRFWSRTRVLLTSTKSISLDISIVVP